MPLNPVTPPCTIAELWRYPVKGMRGERVPSLELDALGIAGERRYAIQSSGAPLGKPLLRGAERAAMLRFRAQTAPNGSISVTTPDAEQYAVDDPQLLRAMERHLPGGHTLSLVHADTPMNDVRPVSLLGFGTVRQLGEELGHAIDPLRFRSNILLNLDEAFAEDTLAGRTVQFGQGNSRLRVTERIPRCHMVTLDPETTAADPTLMKHLDRHHGGRVGMYAVVRHTGVLQVGDRLVSD